MAAATREGLIQTADRAAVVEHPPASWNTSLTSIRALVQLGADRLLASHS